MNWEARARQLQLDLYALAAKANEEASRFRGTSSPYGFGPVREAQTWAKAAEMADEAFGAHPGQQAF